MNNDKFTQVTKSLKIISFCDELQSKLLQCIFQTTQRHFSVSVNLDVIELIFAPRHFQFSNASA